MRPKKNKKNVSKKLFTEFFSSKSHKINTKRVKKKMKVYINCTFVTHFKNAKVLSEELQGFSLGFFVQTLDFFGATI